MNTLLDRKFRLLARLNEELDDHVWSVFGRYIQAEKILFSSPEDWRVQGDEILFTGEDGCRGCYDPMSLSIPMAFFTDTESAFNRLMTGKEMANQTTIENQVNVEYTRREHMNTMNKETTSHKVDFEIIKAAKTTLLSESNQPKYSCYGTKFKQLNSASFAAYAILRGKDWRTGIHDLNANLQSYKPTLKSWKSVLQLQLGRTVDASFMSKEDWYALVDQALTEYPAE